MGTDNIITLFFLIVAALIFLNLRSVLGKRTGTEKPPFDPYRRDQQDVERQSQPADDGKVITLPRRDQQSQPQADMPSRYEIIDDFATPGTPLNDQLRQVYDNDPAFDPKQFVDGAKAAYEMIVQAFAEGDRKSLKTLLSNDVYQGFDQAITAREKAGETVKSTFVGIEKAEISNAAMDGSEVTITMRIVSQLISATYNSAGEVIEGNADTVAEVVDSWSFARDTRSRDPNWKLVQTQSEG
ncbi:Tim44 domain-containing protein [Rhizobium sp. TH2]|uniref:Tim44/TimA family putative adaptor protein n=1 Tax=Rhizobium sp. TH2 TaxID=2775403 RepID=UPI002156FB3D|nr:Tim44/TimA family putative adaptor protein [Rhizobium sp. TH2]UVC08470.1 Tim44 domain-containing protein [Rhizobium sp. TH2]